MRYRLSHFYAICTVFLWASAYVFTKVALNYFTAFSLGFLRYLVAAIVLIIAASIKKIGLPDIKDIPKFILSGLLGFTLYMIAFNIGSKTLSSTTSSIIIATVPILTALFASISLKEKLRALSWIAILIQFSGILILTLWNGLLSINIGVIWMFGAALLLSGYNITQRQYTKKYTAFQSTTYSIVAGAILLSVFSSEGISQIIQAPLNQVFVVLYLGIFPGAVAFICWSKALAIAKKTSDVSNYMFVTPLLSLMLGYIIIYEVPDIATYVGGPIIIFGLLIFNYSRNKIGS
jgi:drug/metabolite transporter (DMT)-like permease